MSKHSHLEFAFLTNFYNGSMAIKRAEYPLCSSISKTIYLCSIISISHFLIFFNLFCVKKENSTYKKSSLSLFNKNSLIGTHESVLFLFSIVLNDTVAACKEGFYLVGESAAFINFVVQRFEKVCFALYYLPPVVG